MKPAPARTGRPVCMGAAPPAAGAAEEAALAAAEAPDAAADEAREAKELATPPAEELNGVSGVHRHVSD
jgi:hypothetical protein